MGQLTVAGHSDEKAGQAPIVDVVGEMAVDAGQPSRVETDLGGVDLDLQFAHVVSSSTRCSDLVP